MRNDFLGSDSAPESKTMVIARLVNSKLRTPKIAALAVALLIVVAAVVYSLTRAQSIDFGNSSISTSDSNTSAEGQLAQDDSLSEPSVFVHVVGAVNKPGVIELAANARVVDALKAAGGIVEGAAVDAINLARIVTDGEQIVVQTADEIAQQTTAEAGSVDALINLNLATAEQLEALPGVGPALAKRILDWRSKNGTFTTVDDLNQVSGIGDKMLENIRSLVTV